jgi:hypothetical protein
VASWITAEDVATTLGRNLTRTDTGDLAMAVEAAAAWVQDHRRDLVWLDAAKEDVPTPVWLGTVLLVNRLLARFGSPQGVAEFSGEFGPAAILRSDPDVEKLLGIGRYGRPVIG